MTVSSLPMQWNTSAAAGSQWVESFTMGDPGALVDITGLDWEFVIRQSVTDTSPTPLVKVTPTPSAQGYITVTLATSTVLVVLSPTATSLLGKGARPFNLWSNPNTSTQTTWVEGVFNTQPVAMP
ncbi:hypothetical protein STRTUCAR8_08563 [Streptomyces turgidiscabies Car8]|uniref:Uncharacterized protein n=1 Tax=Streptomyces turgidiscabies (strain Car8) TaxID=698760 RepID=L7F7W9_STRT8|nr:hypothetical protein [Streptomyces turgidiscabies]ELP67693.1 hypothetical protein STRTUCAR8_08563 [Streptomyces turgidiscabies Car8]